MSRAEMKQRLKLMNVLSDEIAATNAAYMAEDIKANKLHFARVQAVIDGFNTFADASLEYMTKADLRFEDDFHYIGEVNIKNIVAWGGLNGRKR